MKDKKGQSESRQSKSRIQTELVTHLLKEEDYVVFNEYESLLRGFMFYQTQQVDFRAILLKKVIGILAVIGFFLFHAYQSNSFWSVFAATTIPLLPLFPITSSLFNDLTYREGLKSGPFKETINFENRHSWIPPFHSYLIFRENGIHHKAGSKQTGIYFWSAAVSIFLACLMFTHFMQLTDLYHHIYVLVALAVGAGIFRIYWHLVQRRLSKLNRNDIPSEENTIEGYFEKKPCKNKELLISLFHSLGREFIEHFSKMKMSYKHMGIFVASAFGIALGYTLNSKAELVRFSQSYLIAFVTFITVLSINLIRYLDLNVAHHQIRELYDFIKRLEKKEKVLSNFYIEIEGSLYENKKNPAIYDFFNYTAINIPIIIIGFLGVAANAKMEFNTENESILFMFVFLIALEAINYVKNYHRKHRKSDVRKKS